MNQGCPTIDQLTEFTTGSLAEAEHSLVDAHLETCVLCQRSLTTFDDRSPQWFSPVADAESVYDAELGALIAEANTITVAGELDHSDASGDQLGPYQLMRKLGSGGMGEVYLAEHETMQRSAAVKFLAPELVRSPAARKRFQREIEVVARLSHPNIVAAYDAGDADGRFFLVLEYATGRNLQQVVESSGPLKPASALQAIRQAAEGLAYAHKQNVIHRDVKPSNLMMGETGDVKVLDLGLASASWELSDLTVSHAMMGTAAFMPPEQAANPRDAEARSDVYALGATLYYLLTGGSPFRAESAVDMAIAHRTTPFPKLPTTIPQAQLLDTLLAGMIAKKPAERFDSMEQVIAEIDQCLPQLNDSPIVQNQSSRSTQTLLIGGVSLAVLLAMLIAVTLWAPWSGDANSAPATALATTPVIAMQQIEPGTFFMGAASDNTFAAANEKPRHQVRFVEPFLIGVHEITEAEFAGAFSTNDLTNGAGRFEGETPSEVLPMTGVSWLEAVRFCNALSSKEGLEPYYAISDASVAVRGGNGYRLPTEAEWEYACRAGSETRFHSGDDAESLQQVAWFADNALGQFKPVGEKKANAWGLHDMHGNAPEWVWDRFDPDFYARSPVINPTGSGNGDRRLFRGGSANDASNGLRSSARRILGSSYGALDRVGLRVARNVK